MSTSDFDLRGRLRGSGRGASSVGPSTCPPSPPARTLEDHASPSEISVSFPCAPFSSAPGSWDGSPPPSTVGTSGVLSSRTRLVNRRAGTRHPRTSAIRAYSRRRSPGSPSEIPLTKGERRWQVARPEAGVADRDDRHGEHPRCPGLEVDPRAAHRGGPVQRDEERRVAKRDFHGVEPIRSAGRTRSVGEQADVEIPEEISIQGRPEPRGQRGVFSDMADECLLLRHQWLPFVRGVPFVDSGRDGQRPSFAATTSARWTASRRLAVAPAPAPVRVMDADALVRPIDSLSRRPVVDTLGTVPYAP